MFGIEKWIFEAFPKMPAPVRILTYLVILALFVYLLLVPRFVDGQLVIKQSTNGGLIPYRGADLQIQVDGRPYKFRSNEDGWFSIPLIGRLPESLVVQVYHVDQSVWFEVMIPATRLWRSRGHQIEILDSKPFVRVALVDAWHPATALVDAADWILSPATAQSIVLPKSSAIPALPDVAKSSISEVVEHTYAKVAGKRSVDVNSDSPLLNDKRTGLDYKQRIELIRSLESRYKLTIPDEHWQAMTHVGQLVDYVEKRKQIELRLGSESANLRSWAQIQQSFPADMRPTYKKQ